MVAFVGIGNPAAFKRHLQQITGRTVLVVAFPDHHQFTVRDLHLLRSAATNPETIYVTTEKDVMRRGNFNIPANLGNVYALEGSLAITSGEDFLWQSVDKLFNV